MIFDAVASLFTAGKQKKMADRIKPVNSIYEESPYTKALYGQGANLYKGRMAGASAAEQNIATNAASTNANIARNAGDASTALALAAGVQGQADQSFGNLAVAESADKLNRFGVFSDVTKQMTRERDKVHEDKLRNYYDDLNYKRALEGAAQQNRNKIWGSLDNVANTAASLFAAGAFGGGGGSIGGGVTLSAMNSAMPMMRTQTGFNATQGASPAAAFSGRIPYRPAIQANSGVPYQRPPMNFNFNG